MKPDKKYRVTEIIVTVKHRRNKSGEPFVYERRYMTKDLEHALRDNEDVRAVKAKVRMPMGKNPMVIGHEMWDEIYAELSPKLRMKVDYMKRFWKEVVHGPQ